MGYYADRLRKRLGEMSQKEKDDLWNKLSYLNEMGPIITDYQMEFSYPDVDCESSIRNPHPSCYEGDTTYMLAA